MLKLAYIFDQTLPAKTAESEQLINTLSALSKRDYDCTLFLPASNTEENPTADSLRAFYHVDGGFKVELLHSVFPGPRLLQKVVHPALCATLLGKKLRGFDLVYSRNIPSIAAALASRIPAMYDTYRPWPNQYKHALRPVFRAFFADPKFIGAGLHSEYARQAYIDMGIDPSRVVTAHNGYNPFYFQPVLTREEARRKLGIEHDGPMALYSGRMDPEKGIDSLIDLAEQTPDCLFVFIGSHGHGPLEQRLEKLSNVRTMGWLEFSDLAPWFYAADVLMLPISSGPLKVAGNTVLPIKIYSYFAAGRAILAPDSPDSNELLSDGVNACLVPQNDSAKALERFQSLIRNGNQLQKLAEGAAESAKSLTWDCRAELLDAFIRRRLSEIHRQ